MMSERSCDTGANRDEPARGGSKRDYHPESLKKASVSSDSDHALDVSPLITSGEQRERGFVVGRRGRGARVVGVREGSEHNGNDR